MILNERQFAQARSQAERFRAALNAMAEGSLETTDLDPALKTAQVDAVRNDLAMLERELAEYDRLRSGQVRQFDVTALAELPMALIQARIAAGLNQRQLAERLGLKEQQIQRYEASVYEGASFSRLVDVADAIGLLVRKEMKLLEPASRDALFKRLKAIGLDEGFIRRRIAPDLGLDDGDARDVAERVGLIFNWPTEALFGSEALSPAALGGATARFKMPKGRDGRSAAIYAAYAHRLADICATAMAERPRAAVPANWRGFRDQLVAGYGVVDFQSALQFAWDLGVVVLPLSDAGAFHGACWRIRGVNVVVLKQAHRYPARWLFDLLHELRHAAEEPDEPEFEVVEGAETSDERRESTIENMCSWFAGQVCLDGRADDLVKFALAQVGGDLRGLKASVEAVAEAEGFDAGALANYAAFRLSLQGRNWWGAAANLQDVSYDPLELARDVFFDRFAFDAVGEAELNLLTLALHDEMTDDG